MNVGSVTTDGVSATLDRLASMLEWDVRLQVRYGFYAVYAVVTLLYVLGLTQVPDEFESLALTLVVFSDPAFLGFYFIAALVLFEKREGVVDAFTVSPLSGVEYLLSKTLSLTLLAVAASLVVALLSVGPAFNPLALVLGVGLTSVLFVLFGFVAVARFDTINAYFMTSAVYLAPMVLPLLDVLGVVESPLFSLFPTQASLVLIGAAFSPVPTGELVYGVGYLVVWIGVAAVAARWAFDTYIVHGGTTGTSETAVPRGSSVGMDREYGPVVTLAVSDLKNWLRDPLLAFIAVLPLAYALVGRLLVPAATDLLAPGFDLRPYYPLVLALITFSTPLLYGFVTGFLVLEERDQDILAALWTSPLTGRGYLLYRGVSVTLLSFVSSVLVVLLVGLVSVPLGLLVPCAAVGSLWGVGGALLLVRFASNTVEGVVVSKFLGFTLLVPMLAVAFVPPPWGFLAGALPLYWPLAAFVLGLGGASVATVAGYLVVGVVASAVYIVAFARGIGP